MATTRIFKLSYHVYILDDTQCRPYDKLLTFVEVIVVRTILSCIQLDVANCTPIVGFQSCPLPLSKQLFMQNNCYENALHLQVHCLVNQTKLNLDMYGLFHLV